MNMQERIAKQIRKTKETNITLQVAVDGSGVSKIHTPVPFLNHMLEQISLHGQIDLTIDAAGDIEIDDHHLVEDIGITLGQAFKKILNDKKGIVRYGYAYAPLDESLSRVVIDVSGRPGLFFHAHFKRAYVGHFDVDLIQEFFQGFVNHSGMTIHIDQLSGENAHHQIESIFKAFGLALHQATCLSAMDKIPSSKGVL